MKITLKGCISMLFSFFMAFFLFALVLLCVVRFTIMNPSYILMKMNNVEFYENAVTDLNRSIKQNAQPAGFELEDFENIVSVGDVQEDMKNYVKQGFDGALKSMDTSEFETKLSDTIQAYAKNHDITIDATTQAGINNFMIANLDNYHHFLEFPFLKFYVQGYDLYKKVFSIATPLMAVLTIIMAILECKMHHSRRRKKRYLAYAFLGAGWMCAALPLFLIANKAVERIQLTPQYLYNLIVQLSSSCLQIMVIVGIILASIGLFLTYFKPKQKGKRKRDYSKSVINHLER